VACAMLTTSRCDEAESSDVRTQLEVTRRSAQRSHLISVLALVLAGCALLSADSKAAAGRLLQYPEQHVRLQELAVYKDNIASSAVGTKELEDYSVTSVKLADEAVTFEKFAPRTVRDLSLELQKQSPTGALLGLVDGANGAALSDGFSSTHLQTGMYRVTFHSPYALPPVVVISGESYGSCFCPRNLVTKETITVHCMTALLQSTPTYVDMDFSFYAGLARS